MTLILNIISVLRKVPSAINIIKILLDIVGSDCVKTILETARDVARRFQSDTPIDTLPQPQRQRIFQHLRLKLGQRFLNLSDSQLADTLTACGRGNELQNA